MFLQAIAQVMGELPKNQPELVYVIGCLMLLYILDCFYGLLRMFLNNYLR